MHVRLQSAMAVAILVGHVALAGGTHAAERIYVLSQGGAALSEIGGDAGKAVPLVALDKAPAAFALAPRKTIAYVTHPDLGQISVVDLGARRVLRTLSVSGSPFGIAVTSDGRLFVGDWNGAHVSVLGVEDGAPPKTIDVGRAPAHVLLTPDETLLFVANRESDSVTAVRTGDLTIAATIPVGRAPFAMALSPDAARLYVANVQAGTLSVIDTAALKVVETLISGAMPYGAAVTPDGTRVLVTNQQASTVAVLGSRGPPASIKVGGYPEGVVISHDGTRAYVANWFSDDVSVLDLASLKEISRVKCPGGPRGIAVSNDEP